MTKGPLFRIALIHRRQNSQISNNYLIVWASHDVSKEPHRVVCAVHAIVGEADLWVEVDDCPRTSYRASGTAFTGLPGLGHYLMEELGDAAAQCDIWLPRLEVAA